ncbi:MAG: hypothetical protein PVI71_03975 [Desulfobacterales bacterium]|jgi:hypothetical protein
MAKKFWLLMSLLAFGLSFSCAFDVVRVKQEPAHFEPISTDQDAWTLAQDVNISLDTGYKRKLKAGTQWDLIGKIENGDVYKTNDQILTVEGSNIYEACIVVSEGQLVGFYLPAKNTFSPLSTKKPLPIEK